MTKRTARKETPFKNTGKAIPREKMNIITDSAEYIIFKNVRFEATTTIGYLSGYGADAYNSITRFGDHMVFATRNSEGESLAAIYEFAEEPYEDFARLEGRIRLVELADTTFEDSGHAVVWAIKRLGEMA